MIMELFIIIKEDLMDMKAMGIKEEKAQDRCAWRNITGGPTRASADA